MFRSTFAIPVFAAALSVSAPAATASSFPNFRLDPVGWRAAADGAFESRSAGFAIAECEGGDVVEIRVRATPRSTDEKSYASVGIAVYTSERDFWSLSLLKTQDSAGAKHNVEFAPMSRGSWPAYSAFERVSRKDGPRWQWGRTYELSIRLSQESIEGEVRDAETGALLQRTVFAPKESPLLPAPAVPALRVTGRMKARLELLGVDCHLSPGAAESVAPLSPVPPYSPVGPETGILGSGTGFFHFESIDGVDWAVDPVGRALPLVGIDFAQPGGFKSEKLGYAPYGKFVETNYPSREAWAEETGARLREWGFDMLASHCDVSLLGYRDLAHAITLNLNNRFTYADKEWWITPNEHAPSTGFPNVFHPEYEAAVNFATESLCAQHRDDPWLVGWFIDNELCWWGRSSDCGAGLFDRVSELPPDHSARQALDAYLESQNLKGGHGTGAAARSAYAALPREVKIGFLRLIAERYFSIAASAIRRADPNHAILGGRFARGTLYTHDVVWEEAGKYCDAVSFNCYAWCDLDRGTVLTSQGGIPVVGEFRRVHALCRRPLLITEWSFPALDTGRPCLHGAGQRFHTQQERAAAVELYATTMLAEPYIAGYDWFMWVDQPATGIRPSLPEDSNYGLVSESGEPYALVVDTFSRIHSGVAALHSASPAVATPLAPELSKMAAGTAPIGRGSGRAEPSPVCGGPSCRAASTPAHELSQRGSGRAEPSPVCGGWSLSNGLVRLSGRIGGAFMADEIALEGRPPVGRFRALLQISDGVRTLWIDADRTTAASSYTDPETGISTVMIRSEAGATDTSNNANAAQIEGSDRSALFALTARLSIEPGSPCVLAEIVSAENLSASPIHVLRVFMRPYAIAERPEGLPSVPNLWKGPHEAFWKLRDGHRFGLVSHAPSSCSFRFYTSKDGVQHPDAPFVEDGPFDIAPGETWRPSSPMRAFLICE